MSKKGKIITIVAVALCVCAAVYLNWAYNRQINADEAMASAELANAKASEEQLVAASETGVSDYFAAARLTRQESRDEALTLLETASTSQGANQETIDAAMNSIAAMATYSLQETQLENLLLAKNFAECVAYVSGDGVTLAVPAPAEGLSAEEVARITDAVVAETDFEVGQIKVIEVKAQGGVELKPQESTPVQSEGETETQQQTAQTEVLE